MTYFTTPLHCLGHFSRQYPPITLQLEINALHQFSNIFILWNSEQKTTPKTSHSADHQGRLHSTVSESLLYTIWKVAAFSRTSEPKTNDVQHRKARNSSFQVKTERRVGGALGEREGQNCNQSMISWSDILQPAEKTPSFQITYLTSNSEGPHNKGPWWTMVSSVPRRAVIFW